MFRRLKNYLYSLRRTPLHPQWLTYRHESSQRKFIITSAKGRALDIGCGEQAISRQLTSVTEYIGLDYYYTAHNWYGTRPLIFGDAQSLPIADNSFDTILLLDVLEHLPSPELAIKETLRVLKPGGTLILQVPFLYPLHDEPLDFHRWSKYGIERLAQRYGFAISDHKAYGRLFETAGLILNIAFAKTAINWVNRRHPAILLLPFVPVVIAATNLLCWILDIVLPADYMMPHGYLYILEKIDATPAPDLDILSAKE